ncbi:LOW QUALITY PROTEIN: leucine zipper protein 4 [Microcebus murinus]|uniref:LOW QUALITY PROTEIN: leucine zipper protein 4 n=1 Tax=Microcebus murinus TaxID=30608 RepID=UPI003F6CD0AE
MNKTPCLYEIINLRKIGNASTEEIKNEKQNHRKNNSDSRWQSSSPRHQEQREYSGYGNNFEERNHDEEPHQEPSGFNSGQSPLNGQPLINQEECNDIYKAQAEKNQGQSEGSQHQSEGNQDDCEGSQGQPEENQHHSEGSQGHLERSHCQSERSYGQSERSHDQSERYYGQSERSHDQSERYYGQSERSQDQSERYYGQSERYYGRSERYYGQSERSRGQSRDIMVDQRDIMVNQRDLVANQRDIMVDQRDLVANQRDIMVDQRDIMVNQRDLIGQSGRSHGQSERYRRYSPVGRIQTSPRNDSECYRAFVMNQRSEYYKKQMEQRNDQMNMNRGLTPENEHNYDENDRSSERSMKREVRDLFLTSKYATAKSSPYKPKGIDMKFNYQALGNQIWHISEAADVLMPAKTRRGKKNECGQAQLATQREMISFLLLGNPQLMLPQNANYSMIKVPLKAFNSHQPLANAFSGSLQSFSYGSPIANYKSI